METVSTRPAKFTMEIQGSILEALGVNLYSSIAKCLVEFAANSYDSDATHIHMTIPFEEISAERRRLRESARARRSAQDGKTPLVILDPLPDDIAIVIKDDGHGMSAAAIQERFLPLNRNRRRASENAAETELKSESGTRMVMGRKGLGKLAAFGVALKVTIRSKRKGSSYATEFTMDYEAIKGSGSLHTVPFAARYIDGLDPEHHGTTITLSSLRCDAVSASAGNVAKTLANNFFGIPESEFLIQLNSEAVSLPEVEYEYFYPEHLGPNRFEKSTINIPDDMGCFDIEWRAMFRASVAGKRSHLANDQRGARIYCNGRLAAGPTLADLHSGIHNFGSTAYLEVIVQANALDSLGVDLINTNRTDFRRDNDIVNSFIAEITERMKESLGAHSKFKEKKSQKEFEASKFVQDLIEEIEQLPKKTRAPAKKIIQLLARHQGVDTDDFKATAPLLLQSVNSGDVLVRLLQMSDKVPDLKIIVSELRRLAQIESTDALKIYRGRRNGILALKNLIAKGDELWKKSPQFEDELHRLLESAPWLISEQFGRYVTSDNQMATTLKRLETELKINRTADPLRPSDRPDLVFLLGDSVSPSKVVVVELKSPNLALNLDHWSQLDGYINEIERYIQTEARTVQKVFGYLIGTRPDADTKNLKESQILKRYKEATLESQIQIISPQDLFDRAHTSNSLQLEALAAHDDGDGSDD